MAVPNFGDVIKDSYLWEILYITFFEESKNTPKKNRNQILAQLKYQELL